MRPLAQISLRSWMDRCARCKRSPPSGGDTWCLACSGWEALGVELGFQWTHPALRAVATDLVVSAVRQVRALRVTRLAPPVTEAARPPALRPAAAEPKEAGDLPEASDRREPLLRSPRPGGRTSREAEKPQGDSPAPAGPEAEQGGSEESEESESDSVATTVVPEAAGGPPGVASKARPEVRPSRETEEVVKEEPAAARHEGDQADAVEPGSPDRRSTRRETARGHRTSRTTDRGHHRSRRGDTRPKKRRRKHSHRAGRKHKRLGRADANPFVRLHRSLDRSYFDFDPQAPRESVAGFPPRPRQ